MIPVPAARRIACLLGVGLAVHAGGAPAQESPSPPPPPPDPAFVETALEAGVDFVHQRPVFDERLAKIMTWMTSIHAGVAVADYDGDGDLDLYLLSSRKGTPNRLYRNDGGFRFQEVGAQAGLAQVNDEDGVSMDAVFADVDNDGDQDLFIAGYGRNRLFLNEGGRFTERGEELGVAHTGNAAAAIFFDADADGWLDLMVGNYYDDVDLWNIPHTRILQTNFETARNGGKNLFYRGQGDGAFREIGESLGLDDTGWTLALGAADLDDDGDSDVYVANDFGYDLVYRNEGDGTFTDVSATAIGVDQAAGMNVEFGDYDGDGALDIYVTNITNAFMPQGNMLWRNLGGLTFENVARRTRTDDGGWGWGAKFLDYDNDGDLDLFTVNGFVSDGPVDIFRRAGNLNRGDVSDIRVWPDMRGVSMSGYETSRFFRNDSDTTFEEIAEAAGLASETDGRGIATADFDLDGDLDIVVSNCGQPAEVFRNTLGSRRSSIRLELRGTASNRDAIGARVSLVSGGALQVREVDGGTGYSAQSARELHFGLGDAERVDRLEVRWPTGRRQVFTGLPAGSRYLVVEPEPPAGGATEAAP